MCEIIENLSFDYKIYIFNFFNSHKIQETVDSLIKKKMHDFFFLSRFLRAFMFALCCRLCGHPEGKRSYVSPR